MKKILFIQLPPPRFDFCEAPLNIPLAAGFMMSVVRSSPVLVESVAGEFDYEILGQSKVDVLGDSGLISAIKDARPDILCMTLYVWNVQRSLFLASMVKRDFPNVKTVIGGPEVTADNEWVLKHPVVDAGVFGEGESRILPVLKCLALDSPLEGTPGAFYKEKGKLIVNNNQPELWMLDNCPYPYTCGILNTEYYQTAFVETARGCPFKCKYCYYHKTFDRVRFHSLERMRILFEYFYSDSCNISEIYLMDPTFNARPDFRNILSLLSDLRKKKDIKLHTELRADLLTDGDIRLFRDSGLASAEIGLQSTNVEALKMAGRTGDPESVISGARKLRDSGVEVTTGIILGLPGDTPQGFSKTLGDLKTSGAYTVIHPFTLSSLPGTDFRLRARDFGLSYHDRPPYYVYETKTFPRAAFRDSLLEFETEFEIELDHINPPSLVSDPKSVMGDLDEEKYISKWIIDSSSRISPGLVQAVAQKSTDPFTFWFRGDLFRNATNWASDLLRGFCDANPYSSLHIILEHDQAPETAIINEIVNVTAQPGLYLNRYYHPLYRDDEVISPCIWIIIPQPYSNIERSDLIDMYASYAKIIWKTQNVDPYNLRNTWTPLMLCLEKQHSIKRIYKIFDVLQDIHRDCLEEVLFEDVIYQKLWDTKVRRLNTGNRISEKIFRS